MTVLVGFSFVREFVSDPYDGVTGLLDLLKMIQLSQTDYAGQCQLVTCRIIIVTLTIAQRQKYYDLSRVI